LSNLIGFKGYYAFKPFIYELVRADDNSISQIGRVLDLILKYKNGFEQTAIKLNKESE